MTSHDHKMAEFGENGLYFLMFSMIFNMTCPKLAANVFYLIILCNIFQLAQKLGLCNFWFQKYAKFPERPIFTEVDPILRNNDVIVT